MEEQNRRILRWCLSLMTVFGTVTALSQALLWPPEGGLEILNAVFTTAAVVFTVVLNVRYARAGLWRRDPDRS